MSETETNESVEKAVVDEKEDKLTSSFGGFGRWQIFIFMLMAVPVKFSGYTMLLSIIILAPKTTFRCVETNLTDVIQNSTCYNDCVKYEYYSQFENTIISEWNLICERGWLADLTQTINMCGILVGSMVFGFISDRYGRRPGIILSCLIQLCSSFATAFCKDYWTFTIIRFFLGSATGGNIIGSFVLMTEITGPAYRDYMTSSIHIPFAIAEIMMPVFGYYLRSWDKFSLGIAVPTIIYLTYFFILPESPKWLISMGRLEEASVVMTKAAIMNKVKSDDMLETVKKIAKESNINEESKRAKATYMDLVRNPTLRTRNLISCTSWFILGICFYGTSQYMGQTSSNVFITMSLVGALKIPSMLFSGYLYNRLGRRTTLIGFLFMSGVCSGLLALPDSWFYLKLIAGAVGLGCSAGAFTTMYTYTSELFPTVARNMAMGASSTVSRVGSALAPFIAGLKTEALWLPPIIFGVSPLIAVAVCWSLPETKGKKLADTIDEN